MVITNELTTCILGTETKEIIPSLGETFAHVIHNRFFLGQKKLSTIYTAFLQKSSEFPTDSVYFQVRLRYQYSTSMFCYLKSEYGRVIQ